jgi:intracellular sulfur oxidation DsrE/DsrF family protein
MEKYRVVVHIDESARSRGNLALKNIENLFADLGEENVEVELVANGEGITALLKTPNLHGEQIANLAAKGVRFVACANSLRQMGLTQNALLDLVEVVPAGVGELVRKQAQGWVYIRP